VTSAYAIVGALALAHAGMACIALASERQHHRHHASAPQSGKSRRALRLAGWMSLALSLWTGVLAWGGGSGAIVWFGMLSAVTLPLILMLTYVPARIFTSALIGAAVGLPCLLIILSR
jgi:hypothetical protein